jgi:predicted esterase
VESLIPLRFLPTTTRQPSRGGLRPTHVGGSELVEDPAEAEFVQLRSQVFASYQTGDYPHTLRLAQESLERFPEHRAEATFWAACMHSMMGDPATAVRILKEAFDAEMWWAPTLLRDSDLDMARETTDFAVLSSESERRWARACSEIQPIVRLYTPAEDLGPLLIVLHGWTADEEDMEPLWLDAVDAGVSVAYVRSSQPDTSDRTRFYWVDAVRSSMDVRQGIQTARERLVFDPGPILLGAFSAGGRLALELAFRAEPADVRAVIAVGAALPQDLLDFPISEGVARGVRAWLIVGEADPFSDANEALHIALRERGATCRLTVVPNLGHDLPADLPDRLGEAISFALAEDG